MLIIHIIDKEITSTLI